MEVKTLCYNCFQEHDGPGPCPYCGFDLAENQQKFPVALRAGTVLNDRYIVGRVLGQGGFGITYVAFDTQLQAKVAVKEYMPNEIATRIEGTTVSVAMDTRADDFSYGAERFQEEARTLAKFIGHPNIAGVSSYFDQNDTSYFVMDYIEGVSFKSYIANSGGKVSIDETLNVMIPVLRALTAVHGEGFIHRDVTPDNIYISKDGNVKLLDFGSARYSIGDKSKSLDVILKVGYAPKEQYTRRGRQGPFTDVYSCAACFYAALTGYLPPESLDRLENDTLTPVSQVMDIPEWLDKAILKGLAVQPEDRFQSAAEFLDAIENQLVVDVPSAAPAQPEKKKPKPLVIGGIAAALVVAIGLGAVLGGRGSGSAPASDGSGTTGGGILGAITGQQSDGLPPLKKAEVPSITIQGVEYSTDLRSLDLSETGFLTDEDIQPLRYMINLTNLRLPPNSAIRDLSPIAELTELERISSLGNFVNAASCEITDLSPLAELTNLKYIGMLVGSVEDWTPLAKLPNLTELVLCSSSPQGDMRPLENLTELTNLELQMNAGQDAFPSLSGMTNLQTLTWEMWDTTSLEPLRGLSNLQKLAIRVYVLNGTMQIDLSPLSTLGSLRSLDFQIKSDYNGCPVANIDALGTLSELQALTLYCDQLTDVSPLRNLTNLQSVIINSNGGVVDWSPVEHVPNKSLS